MSRRQICTVLALIAGLSTGCGEDEGTPVVENDVGELCIFASSPELDTAGDQIQDFRGGGDIYFRVVQADCGGPCGASDIRFQCGATLRTGTITVSSEYSYVQAAEPGECATICRPHTFATCLLTNIDEGDYPVTFGASQRTLEIPSAVPACEM